MGCAMSQEEKTALDQNRKIDNQLRNDKEKLRNEVKLLLLGKCEQTSQRSQRLTCTNGNLLLGRKQSDGPFTRSE
jgi:hypothetical protein